MIIFLLDYGQVRCTHYPNIFILIRIVIVMGQGLSCFDCCYHNTCHSLTGVSCAICCVGCWVCTPPVLEHLRGPDTCRWGCNQGYGGSCLCYSFYQCIPDYLRDYSIWCSVGQRRGQIYDISINQVAIIHRDEFGAPPSNRGFT